MEVKSKNILRVILFIVIICGLLGAKGTLENANSISGETGSLENLHEISIKLALSSDDIRYLNDGVGNDDWRKVKMFNGIESYETYIKNGVLRDEAYQIRIDDVAYHLYSLNNSTLERYAFLEEGKTRGMDTTSPEIIKLYFNEVPMGYYIKEEITFEQVRNSDESNYITLDSNSNYVRSLNYKIENQFDSIIDYFNLEELAKYMAFYEIFSSDLSYNLHELFFKYNSGTKKLSPYLTINTSPNSRNIEPIESNKINTLIEILDDDYEFLEIINEKRTLNLGDTNIIENLKAIYDTRYDQLELQYKSRLKDIAIKVEEFKNKDPYHRILKERFELEGKWEYLKLSHAGGFYGEAFDLRLEAPEGCQIYYTVDGREPTNKDYLYTEPINIKSRIGEVDIIANIKDISTEWKKPKEEGFKATVIRSVVYYLEKPVSKVVTSTYFVDEDIKERFKLPVISIVTDPDNFFGYENGIYVLGKSRANWLSKNSTKPGRGTSANYIQRGADWERPIHMEWFEADGRFGFSQNLGARINGGWSRSYPLKPLKIYARKEYDTKGYVDYEIFQNIKEYDTFLLRNSGHDFLRTMFKDAMIQSLMEGTKVDIQAYRPAVVFINGEYWGINNVRERQDEDYIESHYEIPKEEVVILENQYRVKSGNSYDKQHFINMVNYIKENDIREDVVYEYVKTQMDVNNFIDYIIIQTFIANGDWPFNNVKYWRRRTENGKDDSLYGHDGKWRWLLFDTDSGFQFTYRMSLSFATEGDEDWVSVLLRNLLKNTDFRNQFIRRYGDLLNTNLKAENILDRIDSIKSVIEPEMSHHINRWNTGGGSIETWNGYVEDLREFARLRSRYVRKDIVSFFNLAGTIEGVVENNKVDQGKVYINGIPLADTGTFKGVYFQGIPITLTAIPGEGYSFLGWEGSHIYSESTLTFTPKSGFHIKAKFEKLAP